jgi:hypothetical protein
MHEKNNSGFPEFLKTNPRSSKPRSNGLTEIRGPYCKKLS